LNVLSVFVITAQARAVFRVADNLNIGIPLVCRRSVQWYPAFRHTFAHPIHGLVIVQGAYDGVVLGEELATVTPNVRVYDGDFAFAVPIERVSLEYGGFALPDVARRVEQTRASGAIMQADRIVIDERKSPVTRLQRREHRAASDGAAADEQNARVAYLFKRDKSLVVISRIH
jgi:hypothetical protein